MKPNMIPMDCIRMEPNMITMEYIRKLVNEKAKAKKDKLVDKLRALETERDNFFDKFDAEMNKLCEETAKKAEAICKKYEMPHEKHWSGVPCELSVHIDNYSKDNHLFSKTWRKAYDALCKFDELVENTTCELIAKLSLGGNFADLERMLDEIKF